MPIFAASRFLAISRPRASLLSLSRLSVPRISGLATVASFTPTSGSSTPSSPSSSLEDSSASFPSPWFMPPPPPPTPSPSAVHAASTRSSTSKRIGRPTVEIGYDDAFAETAGTVTAAKGLEHFVGLAEREEKAKVGGEKKPCTKACVNCKKLEEVA